MAPHAHLHQMSPGLLGLRRGDLARRQARIDLVVDAVAMRMLEERHLVRTEPLLDEPTERDPRGQLPSR